MKTLCLLLAFIMFVLFGCVPAGCNLVSQEYFELLHPEYPKYTGQKCDEVIWAASVFGIILAVTGTSFVVKATK